MTDYEKTCYETMYGLIADNSGKYEGAVEAQIAVWEDRQPETLPLLLQCSLPSTYNSQFPDYHPGEIHNNKEKMLLFGMKAMLSSALAGSWAVPSIRANMGCGIFPSLFPGILPLLFDDGKMPWVKTHLNKDEIYNLREEGIVITDEFKTALEHMAYIAERIQGTGARVYPLDLQGPFDTAHIVYGDRIFYDMYDDPGLIHHLLGLSCRAIELGMEECFKIIPGSEKVVAHYNMLILPRSLGGIKISEDTSTLLSPEHIEEYVIPYTRQVLERAGGGWIHYCGRNDHLFKHMIKMDKVRGINFGNPEAHDMDDILSQTADAGKVYYGGVTKHEGEELSDYFKRVKKSASVRGKCRLILSYGAEYDKKDEVLDIWKNS